ncbi:unnamed protein product [Protopolystoma xenopodis]|uniref:Uncharacterized protein n=1 Tax=Protopolystoma xenopodis TaxID=117903 RepID=A0A3S4ZX85_9PLAT|nr:unnamed protein product [Protopolystoma xenopodis]
MNLGTQPLYPSASLFNSDFVPSSISNTLVCDKGLHDFESNESYLAAQQQDLNSPLISLKSSLQDLSVAMHNYSSVKRLLSIKPLKVNPDNPLLLSQVSPRRSDALDSSHDNFMSSRGIKSTLEPEDTSNPCVQEEDEEYLPGLEFIKYPRVIPKVLDSLYLLEKSA